MFMDQLSLFLRVAGIEDDELDCSPMHFEEGAHGSFVCAVGLILIIEKHQFVELVSVTDEVHYSGLIIAQGICQIAEARGRSIIKVGVLAPDLLDLPFFDIDRYWRAG